MKKLRITVGEKVYEVTVEALDDSGNPVASAFAPVSVVTPVVSSASLSASAAAPAKAQAAAGPADVVSPFAGKVIAIAVQVGAEVSQGDQVATIEAMKMNTFVTAHKAGKVTAICVNPGDVVQEGDALLTIE